MNSNTAKQSPFKRSARWVLATILAALAITSGSWLFADDEKPDRGPKDTGKVLVFSGTGWYRHPETAAISGWLARISDELGMQIDVSECPKDIANLLDRYDVLVLNNSNKLSELLDEKQRAVVEEWYRQGGATSSRPFAGPRESPQSNLEAGM